MAFFLIFILSILLVSSSVLLKQHFIINTLPNDLPLMELIIVLFRDAFFSLYAWTSVLVTLSAGFLWAYIINKIPLSIAYPMASMTYIIMIYADYYFFGIDITMNKVIGVLLVISGIICIVRA